MYCNPKLFTTIDCLHHTNHISVNISGILNDHVVNKNLTILILEPQSFYIFLLCSQNTYHDIICYFSEVLKIFLSMTFRWCNCCYCKYSYEPICPDITGDVKIGLDQEMKYIFCYSIFILSKKKSRFRHLLRVCIPYLLL